MLNRITLLGLCAVGVAAIAPHAAAAADYYDGGGPRPSAFHGQDDIPFDAFDDDRARVVRGEGPRFARPRRADGPGPVVFDERGPGRRREGPADRYGASFYGERGPVAIERPAHAYGFPPYGPRFNRFEAPPYGGYGEPYRPASADRDLDVEGPGVDDRAGLPDVGCTVEEAQSTTPAGWRKIVTHRTCYRR